MTFGDVQFGIVVVGGGGGGGREGVGGVVGIAITEVLCHFMTERQWISWFNTRMSGGIIETQLMVLVLVEK